MEENLINPTTPQLPAGLTIKGRVVRLVVVGDKATRIESLAHHYTLTQSSQWVPFFTAEHHYWPDPEAAVAFCLKHSDAKIAGAGVEAPASLNTPKL